MKFKDKINTLRAFETVCYQMCIFLLGNQSSANQAAEAALIELYNDQDFWKAEEEGERHNRVRLVAKRRCLQQKILSC
ncbi:hypothetical protein [Paenibacillus eucommiae]|uniref:Uncharacterized protein n=1 Tax=Paenibacillus eucommiae TaxID=1355755 RepID=A0ABS4IXQ8_9BACL|nr:hypothetical protein [Paenibacillus eucommiae]MBP1992367.1 hypothetical protein [Paenibacillus eucommiae]